MTFTTCSCRSCSLDEGHKGGGHTEALADSFDFHEWAAAEGRSLVAAFLAVYRGSTEGAHWMRMRPSVPAHDRHEERESIERFSKPPAFDDELVEEAIQAEAILGAAFDPEEWATLEGRELLAEFLAIQQRARSRNRMPGRP